MRVDRGAHRIGGEHRDRAAVEHLALDGARSMTSARRLEAVQARLQQRVDRGRHGDRAVLPSIASISSTKSGLPSERPRCAPGSSSSGARAEQVPISSALVGASGSSRTVVAFSFPAAPGRPQLQQLGPGDAEQEDRRVAREVGDVLDEVEERRLGPLEVVDDDDLRPLGGARLEEPAEGERVSGGDVPTTESGSTPIAARISTSGQYVMPSP